MKKIFFFLDKDGKRKDNFRRESLDDTRKRYVSNKDTRPKFVSCSWSFTCSKYPVYPCYRVTAIESSTPSGRVERGSPNDADGMRFSSFRPTLVNRYTFDYHDLFRSSTTTIRPLYVMYVARFQIPGTCL